MVVRVRVRELLICRVKNFLCRSSSNIAVALRWFLASIPATLLIASGLKIAGLIAQRAEEPYPMVMSNPLVFMKELALIPVVQNLSFVGFGHKVLPLGINGIKYIR